MGIEWRLRQEGLQEHGLDFRNLIWVITTLAVIVGLTVIVTLYREELVKLAYYGYIGVFVACIAANSTVFLPAPSSAIVFAFAHVYSPFGVAVAGGLGAAIGELVGYAAGISGRSIVEASKRGQRLQKWLNNHSILAVFILAFLPLPLFDLVGVVAGASRMRFSRFLVPTVAGKLLKMLIYAYVGAGVLPFIEPYVRRTLSP
jgi:uncharacterized membrane protein YdjX (TVP38/TMEM64 family)